MGRILAALTDKGWIAETAQINSHYVPARTKAMFGISPDVPVTLQDFFDGLHPEDRKATSEAYAAASHSDRRALHDVEYRTVGKEDGLIGGARTQPRS